MSRGSARTASAPVPDFTPLPAAQPVDQWTLPNGQVAVWQDTIQGPNAVYHHGSLGGVAGVFVDNTSDPDDYQSVFTPTGIDPTTAYGFGPAPQVGPAGERYYDKVVWSSGPREAVLRVDANGEPIKAFGLETGQAHEAEISPFDVVGAAPDLVADAAGVGLRPLAKGLFARLGSVFARDGAEEFTEPVVQLGGAHGRIQGAIPDYEAHHLIGKNINPIRPSRGASIAMLKEDHKKTLSWGSERGNGVSKNAGRVNRAGQHSRSAPDGDRRCTESVWFEIRWRNRTSDSICRTGGAF